MSNGVLKSFISIILYIILLAIIDTYALKIMSKLDAIETELTMCGIDYRLRTEEMKTAAKNAKP